MSAPAVPHRLLMTADAVGGVWTYALELARALAPHGVEIALAVMGPPPSADQRAEAARHPNVTLHAGDFALEWMDGPWNDVDRAGDWLLALAADFAPDLVHLNGYAHAVLPFGVPTLVVAHSCVCTWWAAVRGGEAPTTFDEYRRRVAAGLAAADLVVAPTAAMLRDLEAHHGPVPAGRVIHNARDPHAYTPASKTPTILAAGRAWDDAKNLRALDAAAPHVSWPVELAGDRTAPGGGSATFDHVRFLGRLTGADLHARLAAAWVYALPARYEPFGLSALEAALSGCALVLGDIPSLREVWGDDAAFVGPDDPDALAWTLNGLIIDEDRRVTLAHRARVRGLEYSPSRMAAGYLSAYAQCLEREEVAA